MGLDNYINVAEDYLDDGEINDSNHKGGPSESGCLKCCVRMRLAMDWDFCKESCGCRTTYLTRDGLRHPRCCACYEGCNERRMRPLFAEAEDVQISAKMARILCFFACLWGPGVFQLMMCVCPKSCGLAMKMMCAMMCLGPMGYGATIWFMIKVYRAAQKREEQ